MEQYLFFQFDHFQTSWREDMSKSTGLKYQLMFTKLLVNPTNEVKKKMQALGRIHDRGEQAKTYNIFQSQLD